MTDSPDSPKHGPTVFIATHDASPASQGQTPTNDTPEAVSTPAAQPAQPAEPATATATPPSTGADYRASGSDASADGGDNDATYAVIGSDGEPANVSNVYDTVTDDVATRLLADDGAPLSELASQPVPGAIETSKVDVDPNGTYSVSELHAWLNDAAIWRIDPSVAIPGDIPSKHGVENLNQVIRNCRAKIAEQGSTSKNTLYVMQTRWCSQHIQHIEQYRAAARWLVSQESPRYDGQTREALESVKSKLALIDEHCNHEINWAVNYLVGADGVFHDKALVNQYRDANNSLNGIAKFLTNRFRKQFCIKLASAVALVGSTHVPDKNEVIARNILNISRVAKRLVNPSPPQQKRTYNISGDSGRATIEGRYQKQTQLSVQQIYDCLRIIEYHLSNKTDEDYQKLSLAHQWMEDRSPRAFNFLAEQLTEDFRRLHTSDTIDPDSTLKEIARAEISALSVPGLQQRNDSILSEGTMGDFRALGGVDLDNSSNSNLSGQYYDDDRLQEFYVKYMNAFPHYSQDSSSRVISGGSNQWQGTLEVKKGSETTKVNFHRGGLPVAIHAKKYAGRKEETMANITQILLQDLVKRYDERKENEGRSLEGGQPYQFHFQCLLKSEMLGKLKMYQDVVKEVEGSVNAEIINPTHEAYHDIMLIRKYIRHLNGGDEEKTKASLTFSSVDINPRRYSPGRAWDWLRNKNPASQHVANFQTIVDQLLQGAIEDKDKRDEKVAELLQDARNGMVPDRMIADGLNGDLTERIKAGMEALYRVLHLPKPRLSNPTAMREAAAHAMYDALGVSVFTGCKSGKDRTTFHLMNLGNHLCAKHSIDYKKAASKAFHHMTSQMLAAQQVITETKFNGSAIPTDVNPVPEAVSATKTGIVGQFSPTFGNLTGSNKPVRTHMSELASLSSYQQRNMVIAGTLVWSAVTIAISVGAVGLLPAFAPLAVGAAVGATIALGVRSLYRYFNRKTSKKYIDVINKNSPEEGIALAKDVDQTLQAERTNEHSLLKSIVPEPDDWASLDYEADRGNLLSKLLVYQTDATSGTTELAEELQNSLRDEANINSITQLLLHKGIITRQGDSNSYHIMPAQEGKLGSKSYLMRLLLQHRRSDILLAAAGQLNPENASKAQVEHYQDLALICRVLRDPSTVSQNESDIMALLTSSDPGKLAASEVFLQEYRLLAKNPILSKNDFINNFEQLKPILPTSTITDFEEKNNPSALGNDNTYDEVRAIATERNVAPTRMSDLGRSNGSLSPDDARTPPPGNNTDQQYDNQDQSLEDLASSAADATGHATTDDGDRIYMDADDVDPDQQLQQPDAAADSGNPNRNNNTDNTYVQHNPRRPGGN